MAGTRVVNGKGGCQGDEIVPSKCSSLKASQRMHSLSDAAESGVSSAVCSISAGDWLMTRCDNRVVTVSHMIGGNMKDDWRCVLNNMQKYTSREKTMQITIGRIIMRIDE